MSFQNSTKKEEKGKNIQVVIRCRPFSLAERKASSYNVVDCDPVKKEVSIRTSGPGNEKAPKKYTFDMVFGPSAKQIDVYKSVVYPILDEVIMGYNCTIFAYGQTGTGKTFTMEGERTQKEQYTWEEDPLAGVIPRTLHQIFERLASQGAEFSVKVSLLEIYNEELFDLLSPTSDVSERLQMFDDPRNKRGVIIKGLEEISVHNKDEVYQILERGAAKRTTAATLMNAYSSRSHSVFSITIHMKETTLDGEELVKIGKLNLVDLAGSENIGRSGAVDKRAREAGNINQSLLTLGRVITSLVERAPHVPYRESKLTRILQDSLGGRTKTSIIATISPASVNFEETISTLDYAYRAKNILNKPEVNQKLTKRALIKEYTEEIERLKRDLAASRDKNGVFMSAENYEFLQSRVAGQGEQITDYVEKIAAMEEELKQVSDLFVETKEELDHCATELQQQEQLLQETQQDLELTKGKLSEEEFVCDAHAHTEEKLYNTATELLQTAEDSTKDVSGLHAKLDRKKMVEFHNCKAQDSFVKQMNDLFSEMQRKTDETCLKQQEVLAFCTKSVGDILSANASAFSSTISVVATSFTSVKEMVYSEVSQSLQELLQQESLTRQSVNDVQKAIEKHKAEIEEVIKKNLQPIVTSIMELNNCHKMNIEAYSGIAKKMEVMKTDTNTFFGHHSKMLNKIQETTCKALGISQNENEKLKQELLKSQQEQMEGFSKVISDLQSQLGELAQKTELNFDSILKQNGNVHRSLTMLQDNVQLQSSNALEDTASHQEKLVTTIDSLASEIRKTSSEGLTAADKSNIECQQLSSGMLLLCQESSQWCESTADTINLFCQDQLSFLNGKQRRLENHKQTANKRCDTLVSKVTEQLKEQRDTEECALSIVRNQVNNDAGEMMQHIKELTDQTQTGLNNVLNFLNEELQQDIPTGTTPQRREYSYSRALLRTEPRDVLVGQHKAQQQQIQSSLDVAMSIQEELVAEQVNVIRNVNLVDECLENDQASMSNDSITSEKCNTEEKLCLGNGGAPFFKHNKRQKRDKENKTAVNCDKWKSVEDDPGLLKSKLPLRIQN
ncbi:kinesin-like protein KIF11 isoform X1 [Scyliorhinus canicula]|uniref:kinesin-like protein KIF11 isoform X1 n=1 Tax=Scyliorhinus canicula TaxID=7830 RepID=UPI0018F2D372|nr:kinesin-like protein KIF11 isoform X1 [Scyliorhinus canicula]